MLSNSKVRETTLRQLFAEKCAAHPVLSGRKYGVIVVCKVTGFDKISVRSYNRDDSERVRDGSNPPGDSL